MTPRRPGWVTTVWAALVLALLCALAPAGALAQVPDPPAEAAQDAVPADPLGRTTPRGTVEGYLAAVAAGDFERAARYLDMPRPSAFAAQRMARQLRLVLDRNGRLRPVPEISIAPEGRTGDGLDADLDVVGTLGADAARTDLLVRRIEASSNEDAGPIWLFARETLEEVPALAAASEATLIERWTPGFLVGLSFLGVPAGDWLALLVIAAGALAFGQLAALALARIAARAKARLGRAEGETWVRSSRVPIGLLIAVVIFKAAAVALGVAVIGRQLAGRWADILAIAALAWMALTLADHLARTFLRHTPARARQSAISAVKLMRRVAKTVVVLFAVALVLDVFGVDVTTGLAALGIGGLALALGAQKTIENLVGSVMLVADQPIRIGDFCRFGETMGTVEDIGMRSTRVRTLDQTVVTIPNGSFSSMEIENFARRDRFLFRHTLGLRYETTPDRIEAARDAVAGILAGTQEVIQETTRVRMVGMGAWTLDVEIFAYVAATELNDFMVVQETLLLAIMRRLHEMEVGFAFPSRTVYLARDD